jgi:hypothetical protein
MKEPGIRRDQALIAHDEAAKVPQPGKGPFDKPPATITAQLTSILMGGPRMVAARRDNRVNATPGQSRPQRMAVIPPIGDQPLGRRGSRLQVCSQRSTRAIDQNHPLRALAPLGLPDLGAPSFAATKLPSAKHSSQRSFCWSFSWAKKARQSVSNTPLSSQALSRRQHVLGLPYRRGSSLHWAPVQRPQRMPSKQRRSATRGRPPRGDDGGRGRWPRMTSHCSLVRPRHAMFRLPFLLGDSWRYVNLNRSVLK